MTSLSIMRIMITCVARSLTSLQNDPNKCLELKIMDKKDYYDMMSGHCHLPNKTNSGHDNIFIPKTKRNKLKLQKS